MSNLRCPWACQSKGSFPRRTNKQNIRADRIAELIERENESFEKLEREARGGIIGEANGAHEQLTGTSNKTEIKKWKE